MNRLRSSFRPPLWAWLGLLPALALLLTLGTWQWRRGDGKTALQAQIEAAAQRAPIALACGTAAPQRLPVLRAQAQGRYLGDRQILLDNQSHDGRPGYHVWTPLLLADGGLLIVDRGWIPQPAQRAWHPAVDIDGGPREVVGLWRPLPVPGLRLAADNCAAVAWPRVLQYPTLDDLHCLYGEAVLPGVLQLDVAAEDGYVRDWRVSGDLPPQRHYAYALQWYAFAATLLALFVKLNWKRRPTA